MSPALLAPRVGATVRAPEGAAAEFERSGDRWDPRGGGADVGAAGGEPTLDAIVSGAWEGLAARAAVACLVCQGHLVPLYGARALPVGGRCAACGTYLD
ncbi:MAG: hypothetical protein ACRDMJ_11170 [Solirubrobacteraceae bacterium]